LKLKEAIKKTLKSLWNTTPILLGTLMLASIISVVVPNSVYSHLFSGKLFSDSLIGGLIGSLSAGSPITSYVLGGEFLKQGVSLIAVTTFLVSWVTVGIIQWPAEAAILGRRFALYRNLSAFVLAIIVGIATVLTLRLI